MEIETFHSPVQPHKFANELSRAKTEKEAIEVLEKYLQRRRELGYATETLFVSEAAKHPGSHVFSFHGCGIPTRVIPKAKSLSVPSYNEF